ncbi:MAG TPA: RES family NAD+ phosphorylase [Bryobacteraceae bacterium]|nr:RES family NAD+ phosphorylase [Bryobacteraceae bacterium]
MDRLGILPDPPPDFRSRDIPVIQFTDSLFRTHHISRNPIYFGRARSLRFDAPTGSYGVFYAGRDAFCAFIESMARIPGHRIVTTTQLKERALSELVAVRPLRLVDLTSSGSLVRIGADARLFSGSYPPAQRWSEALHGHPVNADGLLYPSRLDPSHHGIALFEDRAPELRELMRQSWYAPGAQYRLLSEIIEHYKLDLIENHFVIARKPAVSGRLF